MSAAAGARPSLPVPARAPVAGPRAPAFPAPAARATRAANLDPAPRAGSPAPETATATLRPVRPQSSRPQPPRLQPPRLQPASLQAARLQPPPCPAAPSRSLAP